ncbi:hypothetical protein TNCV_2184661 [Trichonephila clavipes]|nr:hypothetical protein TNCV_2184661 [Trichonephila clavipes]
MIQICITTNGQKHFRSMLGGIVHKNIEENRRALPQLYELTSPAEKYETVLRTHSWQICTYITDGLAERNAIAAEKLYRESYTERNGPKSNMLSNLHHTLWEYG